MSVYLSACVVCFHMYQGPELLIPFWDTSMGPLPKSEGRVRAILEKEGL